MREVVATAELAREEASESAVDAGLVVGSDQDLGATSELSADPGPLSPTTTGGRLRAGREAAGLTVADIAEVLRFSAHQIEALERDDYARLAGTTLVRGMVRGYAKLLKMKPEPLLAGLDTTVKPSVADVRAPSNIGVAERVTTVDRVSRGAVALVAIFVLLFALLAAYVYVMADEPVARTTPLSAEPAVPAAAVVSVQPPVLVSETSNTVAGVLVPTQSLSPVVALVLDFDDLSWVEISDASQSIVFRGEHPKGTRRVIDGQAPFQLWIGRASAVRVSYGDRLIDLKPHSRDNIARLTVE